MSARSIFAGLTAFLALYFFSFNGLAAPLALVEPISAPKSQPPSFLEFENAMKEAEAQFKAMEEERRQFRFLPEFPPAPKPQPVLLYPTSPQTLPQPPLPLPPAPPPLPPLPPPPPPPLPPLSSVSRFVEKTQEATKEFALKPSINTAREAIKNLRSDPVVVETVKKVVTPVSLTVTAASAGAITVTASTGSATFAFNLSQFFQSIGLSRFYLLGLIRFRRKKPWGKVLDKLSGKSIPLAAVQIYESEFKKLKDSQLTDEDGRFGALVGPGKYFLKVVKKGYRAFESGLMSIFSPDQILNLEISLSPMAEEFNLSYLRRISVLNALKRLLELLNPYLLAFGTLVSLLTVIILPGALNYTVLGIYILFDILKVYFTFHLLRPFGLVVDEATREPLPLSVVRIFEAEKNWLLATKVTDEQGRFNFLLTPGKYYLTCYKAGYLPFQSDTVIFKKAGLPSLNIKMKRQNR